MDRPSPASAVSASCAIRMAAPTIQIKRPCGAGPLFIGNVPPGRANDWSEAPLTIQLSRPVLVNDVAGVALASDGSFYFRQGEALRKLSHRGRTTLLADRLDPGNYGIALDGLGNVFVAEFRPRRVVRISPNGTRVIAATSRAPWGPTGVFVSNGALFVLEATEYERGVESKMRVRKIVGNSSRTLASVTILLP